MPVPARPKIRKAPEPVWWTSPFTILIRITSRNIALFSIHSTKTALSLERYDSLPRKGSATLVPAQPQPPRPDPHLHSLHPLNTNDIPTQSIDLHTQQTSRPLPRKRNESMCKSELFSLLKPLCGDAVERRMYKFQWTD